MWLTNEPKHPSVDLLTVFILCKFLFLSWQPLGGVLVIHASWFSFPHVISSLWLTRCLGMIFAADEYRAGSCHTLEKRHWQIEWKHK